MPKLRSYQQEAVAILAASGRAILAYPPGTGKTATTSVWLRDEPVSRVLIVAPNGPVLQHWVDELNAWAGYVAYVATGTPTKRAAERDRVTEHGGCIVLNYECMRGDVAHLLKIKWDAVVFDESHRLKARGKATFKAAAKLARRTPRLALVTATPILNTTEELWSSLHMIDAKRWSSFWRWAGFHFEIGPLLDARGNLVRSGGKIITVVGDLKPGHAAAIRKQLEGIIITGTIEALLPDLPPVTETYLRVELSKAERKVYDSMYDKRWMELEGTVTVADLSITRDLRLRQLASDWSAFGGLELGSKGKAAVSLVTDLAPEQVLVLCAFRPTAIAIADALKADGVSAEAYHGGLSAFDRGQVLAAFRQGETRVMVGTIATLGEGVDGLQVARNLIMVDRDWTPARNEQAIGRLRRNGQRSAVNVQHLVVADSIDQRVSAALKRKESIVQAILGDVPTDKVGV